MSTNNMFYGEVEVLLMSANMFFYGEAELLLTSVCI